MFWSGPYSSVEMQRWFKTGYFTDAVLIRTKDEDCFHTLAEWVHYSNGQSPFMQLLGTFEELAAVCMQMQMSQIIISQSRVPPNTGPYVVMHQSGAPTAPVMPTAVPGFVPAPGFIAYHQNPLMVATPAPPFFPNQPFSQPPSEPVDEMLSTVSNTPDDSDMAWNTNAPHCTVCSRYFIVQLWRSGQCC
ncbi:unnamed protein product [Gongylonema pulchrum]|uniref:GYF domain-containing protein n=1 Tax=Gongylonema pulchrum TaxID=637853 RepID=A0A183DWU3_9BILA|nr:unnamed protein product [Gongylonema pulchrum]